MNKHTHTRTQIMWRRGEPFKKPPPLPFPLFLFPLPCWMPYWPIPPDYFPFVVTFPAVLHHPPFKFLSSYSPPIYLFIIILYNVTIILWISPLPLIYTHTYTHRYAHRHTNIFKKHPFPNFSSFLPIMCVSVCVCKVQINSESNDS